MTAKEYLQQAYWLDKRINAKIRQKEMLLAIAQKVTPSMSFAPGKGKGRDMAEIVARITDLENSSKQYRVYSPDGKGVTLCGNGGGLGAKTGLYAVPYDCDVVITENSIRCQRRDQKHSTVQGSHVNFTEPSHPMAWVYCKKCKSSSASFDDYKKNGTFCLMRSMHGTADLTSRTRFWRNRMLCWPNCWYCWR